ncbi:MAG: hypothetical protein AAFX50_05070, partial [Acidobacteriota bacterium]
MPHPTPRALGAAVAPLLLAALPVALLVGCGAASEDAADEAPAATPAAAGDDGPPVLSVLEGFGYQPRACGFDLDDDGVIGEPEDCRVCDGATSDPDGDGVDEDLVYV